MTCDDMLAEARVGALGIRPPLFSSPSSSSSGVERFVATFDGLETSSFAVSVDAGDCKWQTGH